uniref:Uncharacterized protein n=1 Tax=Streptomyces auratus AGR0001 TaxID=1160718 RepID=J1RWK0_9ACTN
MRSAPARPVSRSVATTCQPARAAAIAAARPIPEDVPVIRTTLGEEGEEEEEEEEEVEGMGVGPFDLCELCEEQN